MAPGSGTDRDLARFVNALNAEGVAWARRLSQPLLVDLLAITGEWAADLQEGLPPHDTAIWPVSWAGETVSENWMDIGREYTEDWHHQMQIRDAVAAPPMLLEARWCRPLLELSVRAAEELRRRDSGARHRRRVRRHDVRRRDA